MEWCRAAAEPREGHSDFGNRCLWQLGLWAVCEWNSMARQWNFVQKELLPIVLATAVWGKEWSGKVVKCYCDNLAVVEVLNSGYSKDSLLIHLLRCLFFITEHLRVQLVAFHCLWHQNVRADALSRNNYQRFIQASSSVDSALTSMPDKLLSRPTQLDIASLDQIVHSLYQLGLAQSTQRTYAAGKNCYLDFCNNYGLTPLPVTEKQLCYFVAHLKQGKLRHQTVKSYLLAIRHMQISHGLGDPRIGMMPQLELVVNQAVKNRPIQERSADYYWSHQRAIVPTGSGLGLHGNKEKR